MELTAAIVNGFVKWSVVCYIDVIAPPWNGSSHDIRAYLVWPCSVFDCQVQYCVLWRLSHLFLFTVAILLRTKQGVPKICRSETFITSENSMNFQHIFLKLTKDHYNLHNANIIKIGHVAEPKPKNSEIAQYSQILCIFWARMSVLSKFVPRRTIKLT